MTRLQNLATLAIAVVITSASVQAQPKDPALGTWVLNVAKSKFSPGPAPKSQTRTYTIAGDKVAATFEGVGADGKPLKIEFTATADGKDYAYKGDPAADAISFRRIDANTVEASVKKGGKEVHHATRVISKDGKTMTVTMTGKDAKGQALHNVLVFDRK